MAAEPGVTAPDRRPAPGVGLLRTAHRPGAAAHSCRPVPGARGPGGRHAGGRRPQRHGRHPHRETLQRPGPAAVVGWRQDKLPRRLRLAPVSTAAVVTARIVISVAIGVVQLFVFLAIVTTPYFG